MQKNCDKSWPWFTHFCGSGLDRGYPVISVVFGCVMHFLSDDPPFTPATLTLRDLRDEGLIQRGVWAGVLTAGFPLCCWRMRGGLSLLEDTCAVWRSPQATRRTYSWCGRCRRCPPGGRTTPPTPRATHHPRSRRMTRASFAWERERERERCSF